MAGRLPMRPARGAYIGFYRAVQTQLSAPKATVLTAQSRLQRRLASSSTLVASPNSMDANVSWHAVMYAMLVGKDSHPIVQSPTVDSEDALHSIQAGGDTTFELPHTIKKARPARRSGLPSLPQWLRLIKEGQILEPMTKFLETAAPSLLDPISERSPALTQGLMNNMVQALAKTASSPKFLGRGTVQETKLRSLWVPFDKSLFPDSRDKIGDSRTTPPATLSFVALAHIYDIAATLQIQLSSKALASLLRALSFHITVEMFEQCMTLVLLQQSGVAFHQAQLRAQHGPQDFEGVDFKRVPLDIISAIIDAYGKLGKWNKGERALFCWSLAQPRSVQPGPLASLPTFQGLNGAEFPSDAWCGDVSTWNALIRSRAQNNDLQAARHWLLQYRRLRSGGTPDSQPYLEFMRWCSTKKIRLQRNVRMALTTKGQSVRRTMMREVLQMLAGDRVAMDVQLLTLIINAEIGFGNLREAAQAIRNTVLERQISVNKVPPAFFKAIFRLYAHHYIRNPRESGGPFDEFRQEGRHESYLWCPFHDLREVFCAFAARSQMTQKGGKAPNTLNIRAACEEALQASFIVGDLPLALTVMEHIGCANVGPVELPHTSMRWLFRNENGYGAARELSDEERQQPFPVSLHLMPTDLRDTMKVTVYQRGRTTTLSSEESGPYIKGLGENTQPALRLAHSHVLLALVTLVRKGLQYDAEGRKQLCAPWVRSVCSSLYSKHKLGTVTKEDIVFTCLKKVLVNSKSTKDRYVLIPHMKHLLPPKYCKIT